MTTDAIGPDAALVAKARRLQGPVLVLGASGFVGANLLRLVLQARSDAFGTTTRTPAWRLDGLPAGHVVTTDLLVDANLDRLLEQVRPQTVFNCIAYGAYSFETDSRLIYQTNFNFTARLLERLHARRVACYVHAGSSSEYGDNASGPREDGPLAPNSDYSVSKAAAAQLVHFYGRKKRLACANLRLYSAYGPLEDSSRLLPNLIRVGLESRYPEFVHPDISRDFVYIDDVCEAFFDTALNLPEAEFGASLNVGTGRKTTIGDLARLAGEMFGIPTPPTFTMPNRHWDVADWYAEIDKASRVVGWRPRTDLRDGLDRMVRWYKELPDKDGYVRSSKKFALDTKHSVTAVVACCGDGADAPAVYARLKAVFDRLRIDYEIVFVNDGTSDASEQAVRALSQTDRRVFGVSHSRGFGPQAAFRSGMAVATKNACVLLRADLCDPPELIEQFVTKWREGFDVVYGRRVGGGASWHTRLATRLFYRVFDRFSSLKLPHDAGDFSLLDKRVVAAVLRFPERELFFRGVRAFVGFRQTGVDYARSPAGPPAGRRFLSDLSRAKQGLLSFTNVPLAMLTFFGISLVGVTTVLLVLQVLSRVFFPGLTPQGLTTVLVCVLFFGSVNLFAVALVGEYVARVFEEVKRRPHFIRRTVIRDGEVRPVADDAAAGP